MTSETMQQLLNRSSNARLVAPGPDASELAQIIDAGLRAPDHGNLKPTQVHVVSGDGLERLGELFARALVQEAESAGASVEAKELEKAQKNPLRAPLILVVGCKVQPDHKVPVIEQVASTAAAVSLMQTAADALGYASMWRTGKPAYQAAVKAAFGLDQQDHLVSFLYVGSVDTDARQKKRPALDRAAHVHTF